METHLGDPSRELQLLCGSIAELKESSSKLKATELAIASDEAAYQKKLAEALQSLGLLRRTIRERADLRDEFVHLEGLLRQVERVRPQTRTPLLLRLSLGGSAQVRLADQKQRLRYKTEYENFKLQATLLHLALSILQLFLIKGGYNKGTLLDTITNFLLLYAYSTLTLREHILVVNGSNIRAWWIIHHYLCVVLTGTLLIWPASPAYFKSRTLMIYFSIYMAAVQAMQYRYQMSRLYVLRSLARVGPMETTTESAQVHVKTNLAFLLPFLIVGYVPPPCSLIPHSTDPLYPLLFYPLCSYSKHIRRIGFTGSLWRRASGNGRSPSSPSCSA